jgi:hypothetical protein
MPKLKGNANADKLFKQLLIKVKALSHKQGKEYTITEIASLIPHRTSGIEKYESYNYSMTSMFSAQKGRDYFIFTNPSLKATFTELANDTNRNNRAWSTLYGHEKVKINPKYLNDSNALLPYTNVQSVRLLPMSENDPEFTGHSIEDVQEWFLNELPGREFNFTKGLNAERGTLILFQYKAHVIASALLDEKIIFDQKLGGVYRGAYKFIPSSIAVFEPINSSEMKDIWEDFAGFNLVQQRLDEDYYQDFGRLLMEKQLKFVDKNESEEEYQESIEMAELDDSSSEVIDEPADPLGITISGQSQKWIRNSITSKKAVVLADYKCEYDPNHRSFTSKTTGENYVEAHHLIPIEFQGEFVRSLDVEANIISLCPLCHKAVHHASLKEKEPIIIALYEKRKDRLNKCEIGIEIKTLLTYYK